MKVFCCSAQDAASMKDHQFIDFHPFHISSIIFIQLRNSHRTCVPGLTHSPQTITQQFLSFVGTQQFLIPQKKNIKVCNKNGLHEENGLYQGYNLAITRNILARTILTWCENVQSGSSLSMKANNILAVHGLCWVKNWPSPESHGEWS